LIGEEEWVNSTKYNIALQYKVQNRLMEAEPMFLEALEWFISEE
jgi:hypothetical protein